MILNQIQHFPLKQKNIVIATLFKSHNQDNDKKTTTKGLSCVSSSILIPAAGDSSARTHTCSLQPKRWWGEQTIKILKKKKSKKQKAHRDAEL